MFKFKSKYILTNDEQIIVSLLEHPNYKWRTTDKLIDITGFDIKHMHELYQSLHDKNILVFTINPSTLSLVYTTKKHYYKKQSFLNILINIVTGEYRI